MSKENHSFRFPIVPFILEYEYAPYYLSQNFKDHPQYSLKEAIFDPADNSTVEVILTEKETRKRVFYCNSETRVKLGNLQGKKAVLSKNDFKKMEGDKHLPIFRFGFRGRLGTPVLWRVLPTSTPSERGAGLPPMSRAADFQVEYRDIGTTIGEETALKIGDKIFEAIAQPERSSPPYFYAFDGSFIVGRHIGTAVRNRKLKWK